MTEVEFSLSDETYPFVGASAAENCVFELAEMTPRGPGRYAEFFNVRGGDPDRILALADDHATVTASLLREYDDGALFEFRVVGECPAVSLAELGALPREVYAADGDGRIVAEIPSQRDAANVVESFLRDMPSASLERKHDRDAVSPLFSATGFQQVARAELTDRQRDVLRAAFEAGYYEWPREATGEEVADELGITSATFSEHIHAAERKLCAVLFASQNDR
ncbi:helix-turn-helix domain-containing protein [Halobacterium litoreum]|uniref:Bacterio-opsin activator domain-containing protein n=1 Tax=Halobacterium litoreum TaxID=2039234 RepID=A0ABD5NAR2_9EURY|nr:helix-turn-helix domain-containing protein [Halobacterium litoreum]UHH14791.1 helix-turn-helix domain-containing protein [Halobacterium litoreum]